MLGHVNSRTPSAVPDVLAPGLRVVFCGINPGRVSAAAHAHFANPRNDFWRLLHAARFTSRLYEPSEQFELLERGDRRHERGVPHDAGLGRSPPRRLRGLGRAARADRARARSRAGSASSARRRTAARSASGPSSACRSGRSATRSSSCSRRRRPRTLRCRGPSGCAGSRSSPAARPGCRGGSASARSSSTTPAATLLFRYGNEYATWWVTPGGGSGAGRDRRADAPPRARARSAGSPTFELGPLLWERRAVEPRRARPRRASASACYLVRVPAFENAPQLDLRAEGSHEERWFTLDELAGLPTRPDGPRER